MTDQWAVVEIFGHQRHAGRVEEVTLAGTKMLRVNVPAWSQDRTETRYLYEPIDGLAGEVERDVRESHEAHVVDLGGAAIFRLTWCTEYEARSALAYTHAGGTVTRIEGAWRPHGRQRALLASDQASDDHGEGLDDESAVAGDEDLPPEAGEIDDDERGEE